MKRYRCYPRPPSLFNECCQERTWSWPFSLEINPPTYYLCVTSGSNDALRQWSISTERKLPLLGSLALLECWLVDFQTPHSGVLPVQRPSENTAAATQPFMLKISTWGYLQTLPVVSPFNIIQWWLVCNFNPSFARFCDLCEKYLRKCRRTIILAGLFGSYTAKLATGTWLSCDF